MKDAVDVIKMLKACCSLNGCEGCPYEHLDLESCSLSVTEDAIDILKHLQKENESLKAELNAAHQAINILKSKLAENRSV